MSLQNLFYFLTEQHLYYRMAQKGLIYTLQMYICFIFFKVLPLVAMSEIFNQYI